MDLVTIGGGGGVDDNNGGGGVEDSKHCRSPESVCNFSVDQEKGHSGKEPMYIYVLHRVKRFDGNKGNFTSLPSLSPSFHPCFQLLSLLSLPLNFPR